METRATRMPVVTALAGRMSQVIDGQRGHLVPWAPVAFAIGVGSYFSWTGEPSALVYGACSLLVVLCGFLLWRGSPTIAPLVWAALLIGAGLIWAGQRSHTVAAPVLKYRYYGPVEGRIVAIDRSASGMTRLTLDQVALDRMAPDKTPHRVRVSLHGDQRFLVPEPGLTVILTGHLSPPSGPVEPGGFNFQRKAWFDQLGAVGYTRSPALVLEAAKVEGFTLKLYRFRKGLSDTIKAKLPGQEGPFAAAILTGDRADLDKAALGALRASNLAHLLAISGLHMGLLTGLIFGLVRLSLAAVPAVALRWPTKKVAALVALLAALAYLGISGANVATQRAFVMVAVMLIAICLERRALTLRSVAVAAMVVLILFPESLTQPGFQMSFAATTALVAVFASLRQQRDMPKWLRWVRPVLTLLISSAVAGAATGPFGAAHFNQVAHYGLFANLLSVPVMGFVVMPAAILAGALAPFGLEWIGLFIMGQGLAWILQVAEFVSAMDGSISLVPQPGPWVLPLLGLGGVTLCLWQGAGRGMGLAVLVVAFLVWGGSSRPAMLVAESGLLIGVQGPNGRVLNKPKGDGFSARSWLENDGDDADQEMAGNRSYLGHRLERKFAEIKLGAQMIIFDAEKELSMDQIAGYCARAQIVIAPKFRSQDQDRTPCQVINADTLHEAGSLAISTGRNGITVFQSRNPDFLRLWQQ